MGITNKRPPRKETVGAQYICFDKMTPEGEWTNQFEEDVERSPVVKSVSVTDNAESTDVYASGEVYDTDDAQAAATIETEVVAFPADTLAKMRAATVDEGGLIMDGAPKRRPFFAYGKVVKLKDGNVRYEWFPKCRLSENTDEVSTREESPSEQNDTITIAAYSFDEAGNKRIYVDSSASNFPEGLTEEAFFGKPILTKEDLAAAVSGAQQSQETGS